MRDFQVSLAKPRYKGVLSSYEIAGMRDKLATGRVTVTASQCKEFVECVAKDGYMFCPAVFTNGKMGRPYFEQLSIIALYFRTFDQQQEKKVTFEEIRDRAQKYELPVWFIYDSFSYELEPDMRFGIVFLLDRPLYDLKEAETVLEALKWIFPEASESETINSVVQPYQGGHKILYYDKAVPELNIEWLMMKLCIWLKCRYGSTNYKRKLIEFSKKTGIILNEKKLPVVSIVGPEKVGDIRKGSSDFNKNSPIPIIGSRNGENLSNIEYQIAYVDTSRNSEISSQRKIHNLYRSDALKTISNKCILYKEFKLNRRKLSQAQLVGLIKNLSRIESGAKEFIAILRDNSYYQKEEQYENWLFQASYLKHSDIMPCSAFCPHHMNCSHGQNILSTVQPSYHQIERILNYDGKLVGLEDASMSFSEMFALAVRSEEKIWHIIKAQTAIGKTQVILKLLQETELNILIVVPTNKLKREICKRAEELEILLLASPSLHEIKDELPEDIWCEIESLYATGKPIIPYIDKIIEEGNPKTASILKNYKLEKQRFETARIGITTHRRLTNMDISKYDFVLIDEDIIFSTIIPNRETISLKDLRKLKKKLPSKDPLAGKINRILKSRTTSMYFTLKPIKHSKIYDDIDLPINISSLCDAEYFYVRSETNPEDSVTEDCVTYVKKIQFKENAKYIMLSATADQNICEYCFGEENVRFYDCKVAAITGTLNQYADRAMGRNTIRKNPAIIQAIKEYTQNKHTISFKEFEEYYVGDLHFGNCAGCDFLKGKNIDVIGTPHQPAWIYELFAYSLGHEVNEIPRPNVTVTHNGYRFRFYTYDDPMLRKIQFYMIESELEQAVGRARLLRYDCTVNLFSDFPLKQAVLKVSEYNCQEKVPVLKSENHNEEIGAGTTSI